MLDVFAVADILVQHIKKNYANDIAIVAYYGSYAQGTATKRSDLDFFFIPAESEGYKASIQFVLNDISFDFWPISWERAERMAALEETKTTIIKDSKFLYVRSDEDHSRFMALRDKTTAMREPEQGRKLTEKAESMLKDAYVHLYKMSRADHSNDLTFFRMEADDVLTNVIQAIALLNQTYFTKGWGRNREQIMSLPIKPMNLEELHDTIIKSKRPAEIMAACQQLTVETLKLIVLKKESYSTPPSYPDRMKGCYEEMKGVLDKIITACEQRDYDTAYYSAIAVQAILANFLHYAEKGLDPCMLEPNMDYQNIYNRIGLPDLVILVDEDDFKPLRSAVEELDKLLVHHLRDQGVEIIQFDSIEQLASYLQNS